MQSYTHSDRTRSHRTVMAMTSMRTMVWNLRYVLIKVFKCRRALLNEHAVQIGQKFAAKGNWSRFWSKIRPIPYGDMLRKIALKLYNFSHCAHPLPSTPSESRSCRVSSRPKFSPLTTNCSKTAFNLFSRNLENKVRRVIVVKYYPLCAEVLIS